MLGALFRSTTNKLTKTNLLLILTPYIIRDQNDLRAVFERKMQERQEFIDRYFVFSDEKTYEPPKDYSRLNGLLEDMRQSFLKLDEAKRLDEASKPRDRKRHEPGEPIEMPPIAHGQSASTSATGATGSPGGGAATPGAAPGAPASGGPVPGAGATPAAPSRPSTPTSPTVLTPGPRQAPGGRR